MTRAPKCDEVTVSSPTQTVMISIGITSVPERCLSTVLELMTVPIMPAIPKINRNQTVAFSDR